jgi:peptidoglycan/xylan/chitin deacetylase (PgdA/CDA1 family)
MTSLATHPTPQPTISKRERLARVIGSPLAVGASKQVFRRAGVLCITHHRIAEAVTHDPDVISGTPDDLDRQATWVRRHYETLSGTEAVDVLSGRRQLSGSAVAFTFDDGYADNFAAGRMLMERHGIAATFFIATAYIESGLLPPWDRIGFALRHSREGVVVIPAIGGQGPWQIPTQRYDSAITMAMGIYRWLPARQQPLFVDACEHAAGVRAVGGESPFMSWAQIRELRDMGHTIGAHTHTHPVLASLSAAEQQREIADSKRILEAQLGAPVDVFAYPYGKPHTTFTVETQQAVEACGFSAAFSFYGGWNAAGRTAVFDIRRIKVDTGTSMPMFRARVATQGRAPV